MHAFFNCTTSFLDWYNLLQTKKTTLNVTVKKSRSERGHIILSVCMYTRILCSYLWHCEYFALVILLLTILRKLWPQPRLTIFVYLQKKTKIVYLLRNPKDVAVSLYNHVRDWTVLGYQGSWPDFLQLFLYTGGIQQYIIISTQPIIIYHHNRNLIDHWVILMPS